MTIRTLIARIAAPAVLAVSMAAGFGGAAEAAPYIKTCAAGICFNKDSQGYKNDRTYFFLTFNGSAVTHYNVRFAEPGGRIVQEEWKTFRGSNKTEERGIKGVPGQTASIQIQACARTTIKVGPFSASTKSSCTGWVTINYKQV